MRVLIAGASGRIGGYLRIRIARPGRVLRLLDVEPLEAGPGEEVMQGSVTDLELLTKASRDVDAVVHLAGISGETNWARILETNIDGTYRAIETARRSGVGRFVFASSLHALGYHRRDPDGGDAPDYLFAAPDTYYGVGKVAGEALAAFYLHLYALDAVCVRIMSCRDRPISPLGLANWLSPDDPGRLFEAAVSVRSPGFRVVWGVPANTRGWFSLGEANRLGYFPQDDAELYADEILARPEPEPEPEPGTWGYFDLLGADLVGGAMTSALLDADRLD